MSQRIGREIQGTAFRQSSSGQVNADTAKSETTSSAVVEGRKTASLVDQRASFVEGEKRSLLSPDVTPPAQQPEVIRPSELLFESIDKVRGAFKKYENDDSLSAPVYWNTNAPIDSEWRRGRDVSMDRTHTNAGTSTTITHTERTGMDSVVRENTTGVTLPREDNPAVWTKPFSLTLAQWWKGGSAGSGYAAKTGTSFQSKHATTSLKATAFTETRTMAGIGGRISPMGVEGGGWARGQAVAIGVKANAEIKSRDVKIAGQEVNVVLGAQVQPYVGAEAGTFGWVDVNVRQPSARIDIGGSAFVGAKAKAHVDFGLKDGQLFNSRITGETWAGVGADIGAHVGYSKGRFSLGASAGIGLGVGGKIGIEFDVDLALAGKMAYNAMDRDGDGKLTLKDPATGLAQGMNLAAKGVEKAADGFIRALDGNQDGKFSPLDLQIRMKQAGQAIADGVETVGRGLRRGSQVASERIANTLDRNGDGSLSAADVGAGFQQAGDAIISVGKSMVQAGQKVGAVTVALARGTVADLQDAGQSIQNSVARMGQSLHNLADVDNNGKLELQDIKAAGQNVGRTVAEVTEAGLQALQTGTRKLADGAVAVGEAVAQGTQYVAQGIANGVEAGAKALHQAADRDGDGRLSARDVVVGVQQAGQFVSNGVEAVADGITTGITATAQGVRQAGKAVASGVQTFASAAKDEIVEAGQTIASGAKTAYHRTKEAIHRVGTFLGLDG